MEVREARHRELVALPRVATIDRRHDLDVALSVDQRAGGGDHLGEREIGVGSADDRAHHVVLHRRAEKANRTQHTRTRRHDHRRDPDEVRERAGVHRARSTERDQRELPRVDSPLDGDLAHGLRHRGIDDGDDALGTRPRAVERCLRGFDVEDPEARQRPALRDVPEHEIRIGDGRLAATQAVARGAGIGTGGARPDSQRATGVDVRDRTAAGADGVDVESRQAHGNPPISRTAPGPARRRR